MMTPSAPQIKPTLMTSPFSKTGQTSCQATPSLSTMLPSDSLSLSKQVQTPHQALDLTLQKLEAAQMNPNVSQKVFQTSKAITGLANNFSQRPAYQAYLPALNAMSEQANMMLDVLDNPELSTAKPHKLSPQETLIAQNMIFDLAHYDPRVVTSARKSLKALGLSDGQLDVLTSKLKEESKKKLV